MVEKSWGIGILMVTCRGDSEMHKVISRYKGSSSWSSMYSTLMWQIHANPKKMISNSFSYTACHSSLWCTPWLLDMGSRLFMASLLDRYNKPIFAWGDSAGLNEWSLAIPRLKFYSSSGSICSQRQNFRNINANRYCGSVCSYLVYQRQYRQIPAWSEAKDYVDTFMHYSNAAASGVIFAVAVFLLMPEVASNMSALGKVIRVCFEAMLTLLFCLWTTLAKQLEPHPGSAASLFPKWTREYGDGGLIIANSR